MSLGKLTASEDIIKKIAERISEMLRLLEAEKDIRKSLALCSALRYVVRSLAEIYETKENIFVSWLTWGLVGEMYSYYGENRDEWYFVNKSNVESFAKVLKRYLESLRKAFEEKSIDQVVKVTSDTVSELHPIARARVDIER